MNIEGVVSGQSSLERHQRIIEVDNVYVKMTFTLSRVSEGLSFWHLSIKDNRHVALSQETIDKITSVFLGDNKLKIPSAMHPGVVHQFLQKIDDSNTMEPNR